MIRREMKLRDLAEVVLKMKVNDVISFANSSEEDADRYGGWCGIKKIDEFNPDNDMYIIGHYGGEAYVRLYHISTYDDRIGDFIDEHSDDEVMIISYMLADFLRMYDGGVSGVVFAEYQDRG